MPLAPGTHKLGPDSGSLQVGTYREGLAQKVGHDLLIAVNSWEGTIETGPEGAPVALGLDVDSRSLQVLDGKNGVKPLSDKDKTEIKGSIDAKVLLGQPITFRSNSVQSAGGLTVLGELTIVGTQRPASFELGLGDDGKLTGKLPIVQSEWGIKPYKALMGALKVKDEVELVLDLQLPVS